MIEDEKVLVVGCTGQVAAPLAKALASHNEVWGLARFRNKAVRQDLEATGVRCAVADLVEPDLRAVPDDFSYVLNFSVAKTGSWPRDLDVNAGSIGFVMEHCQTARAFLHCSTTGVYQPRSQHLFTEDDPLGDNHRPWEPVLPFLSTYSISKIASEAAARYGSRRWKLPTVIGRLGVPYGDNGGWPALHLDMIAAGSPIGVHLERPNRFNTIHEDDILATLPALLDAATVPATVLNWAGASTSIEEWCTQLGGLIGVEPRFEETAETIAGVPVDTSRLTSMMGSHEWTTLADGLQRMVAARRPELLKPAW